VTAEPRRGAVFWGSAAIGWGLIAWGVRGALHHRIDTRPSELVKLLVAGALIHDIVFAPLVLVAGVAIARAVPGRWRAPVQAALLISGVVALFSWPEVRDYARVLHNPSSLPRNYTANLAIVIAAVWVGSAVVAAAAWWRARRAAAPSRAMTGHRH